MAQSFIPACLAIFSRIFRSVAGIHHMILRINVPFVLFGHLITFSVSIILQSSWLPNLGCLGVKSFLIYNFAWAWLKIRPFSIHQIKIFDRFETIRNYQISMFPKITYKLLHNGSANWLHFSSFSTGWSRKIETVKFGCIRSRGRIGFKIYACKIRLIISQ